jgi:hypothetical protein
MYCSFDQKKYYVFEQTRFSCSLLCASFTWRIAHMQKGAFQHIQEPFQKKHNSNFTSLRSALERLRSTAVASPPRQSGTAGLLLRPSSRACLHAAPGHLRRLHGDPPETQALQRRCRARQRIPVSARMNFLISWQMRLEVGAPFSIPSAGSIIRLLSQRCRENRIL